MSLPEVFLHEGEIEPMLIENELKEKNLIAYYSLIHPIEIANHVIDKFWKKYNKKTLIFGNKKEYEKVHFELDYSLTLLKSPLFTNDRFVQTIYKPRILKMKQYIEQTMVYM